MSKNLRKFATRAAYDAAYPNLMLPNVSLIEEGYTAEFVSISPTPAVETKVVCIINVETTEEPTKIFSAYSSPESSFTSMEIDGVELPEILGSYVFDTTGLHTLKFTLIDNTLVNSKAFKGNSNIISITIPNTVTHIQNEAFFNLHSLTSITMPDSITTIENDAFNNCNKLTSIVIKATIPPTLGNYVFDYTNDCPLYVPAGSIDVYKDAEGWSNYASRIQAIPA